MKGCAFIRVGTKFTAPIYRLSTCPNKGRLEGRKSGGGKLTEYAAEERRLVAVGLNFEFARLRYDEISITSGVAGLLLEDCCTRSAQTQEVEVKVLFCPLLGRISGSTSGAVEGSQSASLPFW